MAETMRGMLLERIVSLADCSEPLRLVEWPIPDPGPGEVRVAVTVCGVCHTELDEVEGRTPPPRLPVIPGHQAVGRVDRLGAGVTDLAVGSRVGVAWIHSACGNCSWCREGRENLCPEFRATGRDADGGYAEYLVVPAPFVHPIPDALGDATAAPLLCAGAIGYRSLRLAALTGTAPLGLTGFGASAHLVLKLVRHLHPQLPVFVFARSAEEQQFARDLGAAWAGGTEAPPPEPMQAVIDTTPVWRPVVAALRHLAPGGRLVINAIRKEEGDRELLAGLDYPRDLWLEKEIRSVANVTRADVREFLALAARVPIHPACSEYPLAAANQALQELKAGKIRGAKVLRIG
ncbi:zinc-dependent alcohol dehydrogenase family protein [Desulfuromonas carbonis]|uniref:zinc-dependent alcohol dehydrogenase family protein n=1 Tax=Desulfuromonas sp. DDH964 TaxID=1823759 RepID=UPI00078CF82A|nr:zinc-dependent alcohol dehydrogenase family protein [Desulfuromonas sp. DDH964]AMV71242.1 zinc-containing alcohol dehydrogenase [Desulfuromonas sp. DDH964]